MKALVTGSSGFIGSAVARKLIQAGYDVTLLIRGTSRLDNIKDIPADIIKGDLLNSESLFKAMKGCNAVFHVAADYTLWLPDNVRKQQIYETNIIGTAKVMHAALAKGVEKIVYTSSVATLGLNHDNTPADESTPVSLADMTGPYKGSKFMAEELVTSMIKSLKLPAVIVNPSTPIGPGDIKPTPTGRMVIEAASGKMPFCVNTGLNFVHVDDVAEGHLLALEKGITGRRYILGGENMALKTFLEIVADVCGRRPPLATIPHFCVYPVAVISEIWARLAKHGEPLATLDGVRLARKKMFFATDRAEKELGYRPRPVRQAVEDAVSWFRAEGYI